MFSERLKQALAEEVVGQPRAIQSVVRSATRLMSGLTPLERSWCAHLFLGPPGTGRAHLVRTLARHLQGEEAAFTVSCNAAGLGDPWVSLMQQLAPFFAAHKGPPSAWETVPKILMIQDLECAPKPLFPLLARLLESGQVTLPDGSKGRLHNCMVFFLSGLCTEKILEGKEIGFAEPSFPDDGGEYPANIVETCSVEAKKAFGLELLAQLDDLVVFRKLDDEHLEKVLQGHFARVKRWFAQRGVQCDLLPAASAFLLERASEQCLLGARDLISIHRREVEFPLADLLVSRQLEGGAGVVIDHEPGAEHLFFTVHAPEEALVGAACGTDDLEIPVAW